MIELNFHRASLTDRVVANERVILDGRGGADGGKGKTRRKMGKVAWARTRSASGPNKNRVGGGGED
jgi:hypothetical protein